MRRRNVQRGNHKERAAVKVSDTRFAPERDRRVCARAWLMYRSERGITWSVHVAWTELAYKVHCVRIRQIDFYNSYCRWFGTGARALPSHKCRFGTGHFSRLRNLITPRDGELFEFTVDERFFNLSAFQLFSCEERVNNGPATLNADEWTLVRRLSVWTIDGVWQFYFFLTFCRERLELAVHRRSKDFEQVPRCAGSA